MSKNDDIYKSVLTQDKQGHEAANCTGNTATDRMSKAIAKWIGGLDAYPGWMEHKQNQIDYTLWYDDSLSANPPGLERFDFSEGIGKKHDMVMKFLGLMVTIDSLKQCEYYFCHYPFQDFPVSRSGHLRNICEMYFGRIYEFRERLKKYTNALQEALPNHPINVGELINAYDKNFPYELKSRNRVTHHERFDDVAIDRVLFMEMVHKPEKPGLKEIPLMIQKRKYEEGADFWIEQVRKSGARMDEFLEAVAVATLDNCEFLSTLLEDE